MKILSNFLSAFTKKNDTADTADTADTKNLILNNQIVLHNNFFYVDELDSLNLKSNSVFEPDETKLCSALISEGDICLDIGANIGYFTTLFANIVGQRGKVIAIEPDPDNYSLLKLNCDFYIKRSYPVFLHQVALDSKSGSALLFKSKDNHGMHRLYSSVCCSNESSEVQVIKGDSLLAEPVDFIKIDIEGYELPALKGLKEVIDRSDNIKIITEFSPLSIGEAGFLSKDFIELLLEYRLTPLENKDGKWSPVQPKDLLNAAELADSINISVLTKDMRQQSNQEITAAAGKALMDIGYPRPLIENLVWIRPFSLKSVMDKLSLN